MEISVDDHPHVLVLESNNCPFYCKRCDQLGFESSYKCNTNGCNFFLHEQCGNPQRQGQVKHPFSTKCDLKFLTEGSGQGSSCDACRKKIEGFHYKCSCKFVKRNLHPCCLGYKQTLEALDGLTLELKKAAPTTCLHCETRDRGWAYVSSCKRYCYHVSCVKEMINNNWRDGVFTGQSDPFQTIKQTFPADKDRKEQLVRMKKERTITKKVITVLRMLFQAFRFVS